MKLRNLFLFALGLLLFSYPLLYLPAGGLAQAVYLFAAWGLLIVLNRGLPSRGNEEDPR